MVEEQQKILDSLTTPTKCFNIDDLKKGQQSEHWIVRVKNIVKENAVLTPAEKKKEPPDVQRLLSEQSKLSVNDNDLLYRKSKDYHQIILPCRYKEAVYKELHMNMIHLGADRTLQLIRERFYWPGMEEEVRYFISNLCTCAGQKKPPIQGQAPLLPIITSSPLEVVGVDFLHLEKSSGGFEYMLLLTDHFIRYTQTYPTKNKAAKTASNHLYNDFIPRFGIPSKILHDQGGEFENDLFKNLANLLGIQNLRTTPYHPQTNGLTERMNQTVLSILRTLPEKCKSSWKNHLSKVIYAYNCTRHKSTGYSPYNLMFGRKPRLPIDLILRSEKDSRPRCNHKEYLETWKKEMEGAFEVALTKSTGRKEKRCAKEVEVRTMPRYS